MGGADILPRGRKTRGLLAILALRAPRAMTRPQLAGLLWSQRPADQARASLRQEIHRLLEALRPAGHDIVRVARDDLSLRSGAVVVDVHDMLHVTAAEESALGLLDRGLLEDLAGIDPAFDAWLATERQHLLEQAKHTVATLLADQADPAASIAVANRLLAMDRTHEGAWRALMRAHAARGERGLALQAFERCRAALGNGPEGGPGPQTLALAAELRAGLLGPEPPEASPRSARPSAAPGPARIGVLPLQVIGADGDESGLASGLAEEIAVALARFRSVAVVTASTLTRSGVHDDDALRRLFGLDFLLRGSVQRAGRIRITLRLLDLRDGNKVAWAHRCDRDTPDGLQVQDEIAAEVAGQIEPALLAIQGRHAAAAVSPSGGEAAPDLVLRAVPMVVRLHREGFVDGGALLARALELRPDYAPAHAWRAYWAMFCVAQGWAGDASVAQQARHHAECAITLDPQDARGLTIAGHVRAFLDHRRHEALELHGRALALNPNLAMAWGFSAATFTYLGAWDEAARRFARTARLSPMDACAFLFDAGMARLELGRRDHAAAVQWARRASEAAPHYLAGLKHYLAALGHAGLRAEADAVRARLLALEPGYGVDVAIRRSPYEHASDMEHYAAGLRLAGLP